MHEVLRGLGQIPLQVRTVPRVIVQDAQSQRPLPLATRGDHLQRPVMEVQVPQPADVLGLVTADLTPLTPQRRQQFSGVFLRLQTGLAHQPLGHHVPPHRGVGLQRTEYFLGLHQGLQVVVVQLIGPVRVIVVLVRQTLEEVRLQGHLPAIFPHGPPQAAQRIVPLLPRTVQPTFQRLGRETHLAAAHRMRPGLGGQRFDGGLEFSPRRGRTQQRTHHREAKTRPQSGCQGSERFGHHVSSQNRVHESENDSETCFSLLTPDACRASSAGLHFSGNSLDPEAPRGRDRQEKSQ